MRLIKTLTKQDIEYAFSHADTIGDAMRELGFRGHHGGTASRLRKYAISIGVDETLLRKYKHKIGDYKKSREGVKLLEPSVVLTENSNFFRDTVKAVIIRNNLLDNTVCSICGIKNEWNGKPMVMILDHINGSNTDHRLSNLRYVCPNCNSQLPTFCSRNRRESPKIRTCSVCQKRIPSRNKSGKCNACFLLAGGNAKRNFIRQ